MTSTTCPCDALRNALTASRGDRSGPMFILTSSSGIGHLSKPRASEVGPGSYCGTAPFVDCPLTHCDALPYLAANPKPTTVCHDLCGLVLMPSRCLVRCGAGSGAIGGEAGCGRR